ASRFLKGIGLAGLTPRARGLCESPPPAIRETAHSLGQSNSVRTPASRFLKGIGLAGLTPQAHGLCESPPPAIGGTAHSRGQSNGVRTPASRFLKGIRSEERRVGKECRS